MRISSLCERPCTGIDPRAVVGHGHAKMGAYSTGGSPTAALNRSWKAASSAVRSRIATIERRRRLVPKDQLEGEGPVLCGGVR